MGKIYWTKEVKNIMDNLLHNELEVLLDPEVYSEQAIDKIFDIREHKEFADKVISVMVALDKQEDEERAERERQEAKNDDAAGS